jgi:hypothetical protein
MYNGFDLGRIAESGLQKKTGSVGTAFPNSLACSE